MSTTTSQSATNNSAAAEALWSALTAQPDSTTAELATNAAVNPSTARKILNTWATEGTVTRTPDPDNPRAADRWEIITPDTPQNPEPTVEPAALVATPTPAPTAATAPAPAAPPAAIAPAPAASPATPVAVAPVAGIDPAAVCPTCGRSGNMTLPPGSLRGLVEDYLREHPGQEFTPVQIAKELNRSSGAVSNALYALVGRFVAQITCERPLRFMLHPNQQQ
ncbi:hypothetical protein ABZ942_13345 [Nocardia sp. NPDC046473]|uniref:hypothetical protein n=1 Tax=Nocardia sp. NPDC046473 TaxID=3155733 RepID=UPI0033E2B7DC